MASRHTHLPPLGSVAGEQDLTHGGGLGEAVPAPWAVRRSQCVTSTAASGASCRAALSSVAPLITPRISPAGRVPVPVSPEAASRGGAVPPSRQPAAAAASRPPRRGGWAAALVGGGRWRCRGSRRQAGKRPLRRPPFTGGRGRVLVQGGAAAVLWAGKAPRLLVASQSKPEQFLFCLWSRELCKKPRETQTWALSLLFGG